MSSIWKSFFLKVNTFYINSIKYQYGILKNSFIPEFLMRIFPILQYMKKFRLEGTVFNGNDKAIYLTFYPANFFWGDFHF